MFLDSLIRYPLCVRAGERKDQKTLEKLRAERQAKIEELKEKTNYYIPQQLIQVIAHMQGFGLIQVSHVINHEYCDQIIFLVLRNKKEKKNHEIAL